MIMKNRESKKWAAVLIALALVLAVGTSRALGREKYEEKFEKTEALANDGKVVLNNVSGDIEIRSWKENQVRIEAVKVSQASSLDKAKENAAQVTIEVTNEAGVVQILTKYPERQGGFWGGDSLNVSVDYKLSIPEKAAVEVKSVSGDIHLRSIGGPAKVKSTSGDVEILGAAGVEVNLTSGDLTLDNILGDVYLKSVSGDIKASGVKGSIELSSISGEIDLKDVAEARSVSAKSVSGNITYVGTLMTGGNYELKSFSGNVEMRIPANSAFDFEASTRSGVIDSDFPIEVSGKISPKEVHGTVNKGGTRIRLSSFSGNIDLKKY
jgi:DUF4097 and DUF4098 domain-containing protein YvlB